MVLCNTRQIGVNRVGHISAVDARVLAPILCQTCGSIAKPVGVKARPKSGTVKLVCPFCEHQWNHAEPDHPSKHAAGREYDS
jgi:hypothetical protein